MKWKQSEKEAITSWYLESNDPKVRFQMKRKRLKCNSPWTSMLAEKSAERRAWDTFRIMTALIHLPCNQRLGTCDMVNVIHLPTKVTSPLGLLMKSANTSLNHIYMLLARFSSIANRKSYSNDHISLIVKFELNCILMT